MSTAQILRNAAALPKFYLSECGQYVARYVPYREGSLHSGGYEAWTIDGLTHWAHDLREPLSKYPLPYGVGSYSAQLTGQKSGSFTLGLLKCDPAVKIIPFMGNTILESIDVVFRRKMRWPPRWAKAAELAEAGGAL